MRQDRPTDSEQSTEHPPDDWEQVIKPSPVPLPCDQFQVGVLSSVRGKSHTLKS